MWAHQPFFSNMDYNLKADALIVNFLIVSFLIDSFLSVMPWCFQSHSWQWHGAPQCTHMLCEKAAEVGFLGVPSFFCLPTQKSIFWSGKRWCWTPAESQKLSFLPLSCCTSGPAVIQSNFPTTVNYLILYTFGVFFLTFPFLCLLLWEKDWQALPGLPPCVS